ncbi:MAG: hypothetical protein WDZ73_00820 [Candidatus Paceibacterota bacterium]
MKSNPLLHPSTNSGSGPVFGIIIIILVLVLGAIVVFSKQWQESKKWQEENISSDNNSVTGTTSNPNKTPSADFNSSTNLDDIENDLNKADFENFEEAIREIDTNIN